MHLSQRRVAFLKWLEGSCAKRGQVRETRPEGGGPIFLPAPDIWFQCGGVMISRILWHCVDHWCCFTTVLLASLTYTNFLGNSRELRSLISAFSLLGRQIAKENSMTFMQSIRVCFSKYVNFSGRASRSECWYFMLFAIVLTGLPLLAAAIVRPILFNIARSFEGDARGEWFVIYDYVGLGLGALTAIIFAAVILPAMSVIIRRFHDFGAKGWMAVLILLPGINVWMVYLLISEGTDGDNAYGGEPLNGTAPLGA